MFANATGFALGFGITNWPEAHNTHTPSQRRAPRLLPELSSRADSWHTLLSPPWTFRKPLSCSHLDRSHPPGPERLAVETFPSFPGAHLQVSSPAAAPQPQQGALCYHFCSGTPHPTPAIRLAFRNPPIGKLAQTSEPPTPVRPGGRSLPPACASAREPGGPAGSSLRAGEAREALAAGRATTLLTLQSPRTAWRGCEARCGVRDPGRCGPSRCWPRRGLELGGGASLLGWERPAGQGGSGTAKSPPRPTAAGGGPASPGRFHLRVGPCLRAPRCQPQVPAPAATRSQSGAKGRRAAARAAKEEERTGRGTVATPAVGAWAPAARCAPTESRANFSGGAADHSAPAFPNRCLL